MLLTCVYRVMDALGKFGEHIKELELLLAATQATLTLLSCSPNFLRASITRYMHVKHEPIIVKYFPLKKWLSSSGCDLSPGIANNKDIIY